jgi:hypothetical protein
MTKTVTDSYARQLQLLHKQKSSFGDSGRYKHIDQWLANNRCSSRRESKKLQEKDRR